MSNRMNVAIQSLSKASRSRTRRISISLRAAITCFACFEAISVALSSTIGQTSFACLSMTDQGDIWSSFSVGLPCGLIFVAISKSRGLYHPSVVCNFAATVRSMVLICLSTIIVFSCALFFLKQPYSRGTVAGFAAAVIIFLPLIRYLFALSLSRLMHLSIIEGEPVFVIGEAGELESFPSNYLHMQYGLREIGRLKIVAPFPTNSCIRSRIQSGLASARMLGARVIILALNPRDVEQLYNVEVALRETPLPVKLLPNRIMRAVAARPGANGREHLGLLDIQRAPMSLMEQWCKRAVDITTAMVAVTALSPLFLIIALAIRIDSPGPVIFRQRRTGFNREPFVLFKFRTMQVVEDGTTIKQAVKGDSRVTRVGRFLRRSSLDELPQLFNVIEGKMSLVGPRPHALAHDDLFSAQVDDYCIRHHVKPGITGWAQVNGHRGETATSDIMQQRIDRDIWYINNWSLTLDFRIIGATFLEVLSQKAY